MKEFIELSDVQRIYLATLVQEDIEKNGYASIHDEEIPSDINTDDGEGNCFKNYLLANLVKGLGVKNIEKVEKGNLIEKIEKKV